MACACGAPITQPARGRKRKHCSASCRQAARTPRARRQRKVAVHRCARCSASYTKRQGKYCSSACGKAAANGRRRAERKCSRCGQAFRPKHNTRLTFCSRGCAHAFQKERAAINGAARSSVWFGKCSECERPFTATRRRALCGVACRKVVATRKNRSRRLKPAFDATCGECGVTFRAEPRTGRGPRRTAYCSLSCSNRCTRRTAKMRREDRMKQRPVERVGATVVFERDDWTCGICGEPTERGAVVPDPRAPTLDHVIPLSRGGHHTYENVRCAHFICNALRGNDIDGVRKSLKAPTPRTAREVFFHVPNTGFQDSVRSLAHG